MQKTVPENMIFKFNPEKTELFDDISLYPIPSHATYSCKSVRTVWIANVARGYSIPDEKISV